MVMASELTSSTPEKGLKRPKLDNPTSISILDLDLSPIRSRENTLNSSISSLTDHYTVFPSFTSEADQHTSNFASHEDIGRDSMDKAFFLLKVKV